MNTPNPLQELAEKLLVVIGDTDTDEQFIEKALPILTASVGTLLQESYVAGAMEAAEIALRDASIIASQHNNAAASAICDMEAENIVKLTNNAASALSAVVQRETEKLREHLRWAMERVGNRMDGIYRTKGETYDCHYICPGCSAESSIKEFQHRPDCEYAAALAGLQ